MKTAILAILACIGIAGATSAHAEAPASEAGWGNYYFGLQYGSGTTDFTGAGAAEDFGDYDAAGFHLGYQRAYGKMIVGGEASYDLLDPADEVYADLFRLRAKLGYDAGRFMPYASLGLANIDLDIGGFNDDREAVSYGVGFDYRVADFDIGSIAVGAEYSRFNWTDINEQEFGSGTDLDSGLLQFRVTYRY